MSKYLNKKVEYNGEIFDSKKELKRYQVLESMEKRGEITKLERQVPYVLIGKTRDPYGKAVREIKYIADFVYNKDGNRVVEDVKGYRRGQAYAVFIIKKKLMYSIYGLWIEEI